jgi:hypothetical protein
MQKIGRFHSGIHQHLFVGAFDVEGLIWANVDRGSFAMIYRAFSELTRPRPGAGAPW